jgi:drug/metabolite transporter (DMT)-like permease
LRRWAALQALGVTFLWSTSWVIIKIGLQNIPALTFAGLRYTLAFLCLLPFAWLPSHRETFQKLTRRQWGQLIGLGLLFYAVTQGALPPLTVTVVSMGVGAPALLVAGVATQSLPPLTPLNWAFVLWLAVVNTAFAFTLWDHTLRTLTAVESSLINSTMLIQIAVLAWFFLDEPLTAPKILGLALAGVGVLVAQLRRV